MNSKIREGKKRTALKGHLLSAVEVRGPSMITEKEPGTNGKGERRSRLENRARKQKKTEATLSKNRREFAEFLSLAGTSGFEVQQGNKRTEGVCRVGKGLNHASGKKHRGTNKSGGSDACGKKRANGIVKDHNGA